MNGRHPDVLIGTTEPGLHFSPPEILKRRKGMKKWLKVVGGVVLTLVGIWLIVIFAPQVLEFLKGVVGILVAVMGLIILAIGISELKE